MDMLVVVLLVQMLESDDVTGMDFLCESKSGRAWKGGIRG